MSKKDIDVTVADLGNYYKIDINKDGESMSGGMIAGIVIGFIFFLIVGIILLIVWASKINKNSIHISFNLEKNDWQNQLNKQLLINNLGNYTEYVKDTVISKIEILNS